MNFEQANLAFEEALKLGDLGRNSEALERYNSVIDSFGQGVPQEPDEQKLLICAYFNKAIILDRLNQLFKAEDTYGALFVRCLAFLDPAMAGRILINAGYITFRQRGRLADTLGRISPLAPQEIRDAYDHNASISHRKFPEMEPFYAEYYKAYEKEKFLNEDGLWSVSLGKLPIVHIPAAIYDAIGKRELRHYGIITPSTWVDVGTETTSAENLKNAIELDERGVPLTAPAEWLGKDKSDVTLDAFFRKWWARYLKKGLTLSDIKRLDPTLHNSLKRHFRNKLWWPDDLEFPNERKTLQWAVAQFKLGNVEVLTPKQVIAVGRWLKRQESKPTKPPRERVQAKTPRPRARGLGS